MICFSPGSQRSIVWKVLITAPVNKTTKDDICVRMSSESELTSQKLREHLRTVILKARNELARLEQALEAVDTGDLVTLERLAGREAPAPMKQIRDLRLQIMELLRIRQGSTTAEISEALYRPEYQISGDLFRRRVIVTTSLLYKKYGTLQQETHPSSKVVRWFFKEDVPPNPVVGKEAAAQRLLKRLPPASVHGPKPSFVYTAPNTKVTPNG